MRTPIVLLAVLLACCGQASVNASSLESLASAIGSLTIDPTTDGHITAGTVQYRIYESGEIYYSGDVTYRVAGSLKATLPFSGKVKFAPKSVLSSSYVTGATWTETKASLTVTANANGVATVASAIVDKTNVDSSNANGVLTLNTRGKVVAISAADIRGSIFEGTPAEMSLHLRLINGNSR